MSVFLPSTVMFPALARRNVKLFDAVAVEDRIVKEGHRPPHQGGRARHDRHWHGDHRDRQSPKNDLRSRACRDE
ncbi:unnamed protein product [Musa textilis]